VKSAEDHAREFIRERLRGLVEEDSPAAVDLANRFKAYAHDCEARRLKRYGNHFARRWHGRGGGLSAAE
jgi:hypothetical protein